MQTPFDRRILWVHWKGDAVQERTIGEMADVIVRDTPSVAGVLVKSSNGAVWQGDLGDKRAMAITGTESIKRWVDELAQRGLETHLWCVITGNDIFAEAQLIVQACQVPGVKSMLLDVEGGTAYFGGKTAADARNLIARIRAGIDPDFHLGLNFDARGSHPASIHIDEWIPHVQSLHPMVYHWEFGSGRNGPERYLDDAFGVSVRYGLPVIPMLQTYPNPTNPPNPMPEDEIVKAGTYAFQKGATGITLFRYGGESSAAAVLAGVRRIDPMQQAPSRLPERRLFRVTALNLRVRDRPGTQNTTTVKVIPNGEEVVVNGVTFSEVDGYVWWKSEDGWLAQQRIDRRQVLMIELTPAYPPYGLPLPPEPPVEPPPGTGDDEDDGGSDIPVVEKKRFRVVASVLNVRSQPQLSSEYITDVKLRQRDEVLVEADAWVEQNGFIWWNHGAGWSAERALTSNIVFMEDLTPEIPRKDPIPTDNPTPPPVPTPGPIPDPTPIPNKVFRVLSERLNVRSEPGLARRALTGTALTARQEITVPATAWREVDSHIWWQHSGGWSAERSSDGRILFMTDLTPNIPRIKPSDPEPEPGPTPVPVEEFDPIPPGFKRFQVLPLGLRVRSGPSNAAQQVGTLLQGDWLNIDATQNGVRVEADGYVWWRHSTGWSAERSIDGRYLFMLDIGALPGLGSLVERLPVRIEETDWVQYYGNTGFAYRNGVRNSYHTFSQGLHSGLDFGKFITRQGDPPVFSGVHGVFDGRGTKYGPNRLDVRVGSYRIIYGHLGNPASIPRFQSITPDTVMGVVEYSQIHLHFEVRYRDAYIINPLLLMPQALVTQFMSKFPPEEDTFMRTASWNRFQTAFDQPVIRLAGEVIGPTA